MSVGILIITHGDVGRTLLDAAERMLGTCPLAIESLQVSMDVDPDVLHRDVAARLERVDGGDGVLILSDIYGGTPSNVARAFCDTRRVYMVSGVNLPMLVRIMNYPHLDAPNLVIKAVTGGVDGIHECEAPESE